MTAGAQALAICFLFSFLNPDHEGRARALIEARLPNIMVSVSHEVDPAFREYERTVATAFDAYVKPVVDRYLAHLEAGLAKAGIGSPLQVMQSRGGLSVASVARERPVRLFLSGPAAGVIGGQIVGTSASFDNLITIDIGGTSADIALISRSKPMLRAEGQIGEHSLRVPMVDVNTIGAGGGSIATVDGAGGLRVGPQSAGSEPGPACYGRGGREATVTDASIVLGYLDPSYFAGGTMSLDPVLSENVIDERVAKPLGLSRDNAALGIHRVLNAQMAEGIRLVSVRQGIDARDFALVPLGGAGGLHATALAARIEDGPRDRSPHSRRPCRGWSAGGANRTRGFGYVSGDPARHRSGSVCAAALAANDARAMKTDAGRTTRRGRGLHQLLRRHFVMSANPIRSKSRSSRLTRISVQRSTAVFSKPTTGFTAIACRDRQKSSRSGPFIRPAAAPFSTRCASLRWPVPSNSGRATSSSKGRWRALLPAS